MSQDHVSKPGLTTDPLDNSYKIAWINGENITILLNYKLDFYFVKCCKETVSYDVLPMTFGHILSGGPWHYDQKVIRDEYY